MYEELEGLESKLIKREFPLNIAIEVSNHCNLNCIMCGSDKIKRARGYMPIKTYKRIIDEVAVESPSCRIWLDFYGEALLVRWKLYYMIDYAKKKGLTSININTNGTLLDEDMAEMLLDSGIDYISLDVDGYSSEVYEKIRVGGKRDVLYKNIEYLLKRKKELKKKVIIDIKVIEMEENKHEVDMILEHFRKLGAWTAVRRLISWAGEKETTNVDSIGVNRIACAPATGTCAITWDGNVANCGLDGEADIIWGNVNELAIKKIWEKRNEEMVIKHLEHKFSELPEMCQKCTDWMFVGEKRWDEKGNIIERNYNSEKGIYEK